MRRLWRSRARVALEMRQAPDGAWYGTWEEPVPRVPLLLVDWPLRCLLGWHRPVGIWETIPDLDEADSPPLHGCWTTRCAHCGKRTR